eukprot:TRINITY_DN3978_c0_g1_i1.p1 TRINITY_DN3978_c0_g1~~TRINITY_DN3978_c0_g1_i1.p1  ORF type:complete len:228 (+),score=36.24 TRINITY_DN3978_c0_g1_i1:98-781(+)
MAGSVAGMASQDPYEILGVERNATAAAIRSKFLKEARRWHPDKRPAEESEEARVRFIAIHAAYEKISSETPQQGDGDRQHSGISNVFKGSRDAYELARANREEAEEYLKETRSECLQDRYFTDEEWKVLQTSWRRAAHAVEVLRREEIHFKVMMSYEAAYEAAESRGSEVTAPQPTPQIDGPRTMSDRLEGAGDAFKEIFTDVCGAYFAFWREVRSRADGDEGPCNK